MKSLLASVPESQQGLYRYAGREILSEDPAVIAKESDYIALVRTDEIVFTNRYVQEVKCTILTPYKGIFGLGSSPDPAENATPPATEIKPGHRVITVLFPAGLDVSARKKWLVFLYEDAEYRISSRTSAIAADAGEPYDRFLAAVTTEMAVAPTPEPVTPTPEPPQKVFTLLTSTSLSWRKTRMSADGSGRKVQSLIIQCCSHPTTTGTSTATSTRRRW